MEVDYKTLKFWPLVLTFSLFKFLFYKSYRSTDFEVHRNWLAITNSLPLQEWYYSETSQWTLDYPPFFAYFEWLLSQFARFVDPDMLKVNNLEYASESTVLFQRLSVIVADFVLAFGIYECAESFRSILPGRVIGGPFGVHKTKLKLFALIFANAGLFMVDHIHFQYNGFLFGILLLSIARIVQGKIYQGAFLFAALLNFKHIFLYIAPAFGIFLFRRYCISTTESRIPFNLKNLFGLKLVVLSVFALSFGPFYQHIPQILRRLFPFKRGLSHAYWAPNIWAIYNSIDLGLNYFSDQKKSGTTSGMVGEHELTHLPQIEPIHTFAITLIFMIPTIWKIWNSPSETNFIKGIILTAWTSFMFGYHIHEKAILCVIIPSSLISFLEPKLFFLTLISGTISLFPLLFTPFEIISKLFLSLFHFSVAYSIFFSPKSSISASSSPSIVPTPPITTFHWFEIIYLLGFIPLYIVENFAPFLQLPIFNRYPFLPLICVSDYCFIGLFYCYLRFYWNFLTFNEDIKRYLKRKNL